ncbi:MAG: mercuric transport protein MerTP [Saprospiraceae bacterium]|nr:mercuric transport protein MerTP [Saprospiraceae bacterium]
MELQKSSVGVGVIAAIASSLCCITPLVAILAGSTSLAASFQWVEPLRPWLIGATIAALGLAWYLKLRPVNQDDCCDVDQARFWNGKPFLGAITAISILMLTLPLYAGALYPSPVANEEVSLLADTTHVVELGVVGMTCDGCEAHVEQAVGKLAGIAQVHASYRDSNTVVEFDPEKTSIGEITRAIESTSYKVTHSTLKPSQKID